MRPGSASSGSRTTLRDSAPLTVHPWSRHPMALTMWLDPQPRAATESATPYAKSAEEAG